MCQAKVVEDEFHFLFNFDKYVNEHEKLYNVTDVNNPVFIAMNNEEKLIYLMTYEYKKLALYTEQAWSSRQNSLYI